MEGHLRTQIGRGCSQDGRMEEEAGSRSLVHHSEQGVHYTALSFSERLKEVGIIPSMGRTGTVLWITPWPSRLSVP
jgi:transposase InsO family protein